MFPRFISLLVCPAALVLGEEVGLGDAGEAARPDLDQRVLLALPCQDSELALSQPVEHLHTDQSINQLTSGTPAYRTINQSMRQSLFI